MASRQLNYFLCTSLLALCAGTGCAVNNAVAPDLKSHTSSVAPDSSVSSQNIEVNPATEPVPVVSPSPIMTPTPVMTPAASSLPVITTDPGALGATPTLAIKTAKLVCFNEEVADTQAKVICGLMDPKSGLKIDITKDGYTNTWLVKGNEPLKIASSSDLSSYSLWHRRFVFSGANKAEVSAAVKAMKFSVSSVHAGIDTLVKDPIASAGGFPYVSEYHYIRTTRTVPATERYRCISRYSFYKDDIYTIQCADKSADADWTFTSDKKMVNTTGDCLAFTFPAGSDGKAKIVSCDSPTVQTWAVSGEQIKAAGTEKCLHETNPLQVADNYAQLTLVACDPADAAQHWVFGKISIPKVQ
ncbi:MAG: ricin-type beta-trefoil lectin domain protein [Chitinophagaceae bacterium]|nr:ricin-type beta-trefoil lectin domain protein [Oligoflexus sp.]